MKKYTHRDQILKDIDRSHTKIKKLEALAQAELDAESLYEGTADLVRKNKHHDEADKWLARVKYQKERRLKALGEKLAEFDTMPLPGTETKFSPRDFMLAHQYLYYVASSPIWGDFEYDKFCEKNGLEGNGGSDVASSYDPKIITLAKEMLVSPDKYPIPIGIYG